MIIIVLSIFALSLLVPLLYKYLNRLTGWALAVLTFGLTLYFVSYIGPVTSNEVINMRYEWAPYLNVDFSFLLDGLSLLFSLLIAGIGALILAYSSSYMPRVRETPRFYVYMLMFMGSMLGLVLSENLVTMFVFWELTSISSYMLIGFYHESEESRKSSLQALLITAGGGLALLAGILVIGQVAGSYGFLELLDRAETIKLHPLYLTILILVLLGAFTKSAQFPFHFWLPGAMVAPTPVSAYLHSATMVTAGVYLLARLSPVLGGTAEWHYIITTVGTVTMLIGAVVSFYQRDLKRILAYSTVSALGTMMLLIGLDTTYSIKALMVFLLVHSLYKATLFLAAGSIDHETGTRNVDSLGGLYKFMPVTALAALLAALSMAGLPPLLGFIGKELVYEAKLQTPGIGTFAAAAGITANAVLAAVAGILSIQTFFGARKDTPKKPHEAPWSMLLGPVLLSIGGFVIGLFPDTLLGSLISAATGAVRAEQTIIRLSLWHGINLVLMLSIVTLLGGVSLYLGRSKIKSILNLIPASLRADYVYRGAIESLIRLADAQTRIVQSGYLRHYILIVVLTTIGLVGGTLIFKTNMSLSVTNLQMTVYEFLVVVSIIIGVAISVLASSRLTAIVGLSVVGFGITIIFILFAAPDLAITQFAVETLTVILLILVIYRLPKFLDLSSASAKFRDTLIAISLGGLISVLLLGVVSEPMDSTLKEYFGQSSLSLGYGLNVVNVILVDFRAIDTLGECIVLVLAAFGIYALLKLRMEK